MKEKDIVWTQFWDIVENLNIKTKVIYDQSLYMHTQTASNSNVYGKITLERASQKKS